MSEQEQSAAASIATAIQSSVLDTYPRGRRASDVVTDLISELDKATEGRTGDDEKLIAEFLTELIKVRDEVRSTGD